MTFAKPFVATLAILAVLGLATSPASARKHHKMTSQTQAQTTSKSKTTTGQSTGQMKSSGGATKKESAGMGSSSPNSQASPKQTK